MACCRTGNTFTFLTTPLRNITILIIIFHQNYDCFCSQWWKYCKNVTISLHVLLLPSACASSVQMVNIGYRLSCNFVIMIWCRHKPFIQKNDLDILKLFTYYIAYTSLYYIVHFAYRCHIGQWSLVIMTNSINNNFIPQIWYLTKTPTISFSSCVQDEYLVLKQHRLFALQTSKQHQYE